MRLIKFTVSSIGVLLSVAVFAGETAAPSGAYKDEATGNICMTPELASTVVNTVLALKLVEQENELCKKRIDIKEQIEKEMDKMISNLNEQVLQMSSIVQKQENKLVTQSKWYNNKILWFVVGTVVGVSVPTAILLSR